MGNYVSIDDYLSVLGHTAYGYSMREKYREGMPLTVLEANQTLMTHDSLFTALLCS